MDNKGSPMHLENTQSEVMTNATGNVPYVTPESSAPTTYTNVLTQAPPTETPSGTEPEKPAKKGLFSGIKNAFATHSKGAIIGFFVKKIVAYGLTVVLSFFTAVKTVEKRTFQDDFKDYYHEILVPVENDMNDVLDFINYANGIELKKNSFKHIMEYYEDNQIRDKLNSAQSALLSYASSNKDIAEVNNLYIDLTGEILNFTSLIYAYSYTYEVSNGNIESDFGRYFICEMLAIQERMQIKINLLEEAQKEKLEKYGISQEDFNELTAE